MGGKDSSRILLNAKHDPQQSEEESALYRRGKNKEIEWVRRNKLTSIRLLRILNNNSLKVSILTAPAK